LGEGKRRNCGSKNTGFIIHCKKNKNLERPLFDKRGLGGRDENSDPNKGGGRVKTYVVAIKVASISSCDVGLRGGGKGESIILKTK